jgi:hypothetical protein
VKRLGPIDTPGGPPMAVLCVNAGEKTAGLLFPSNTLSFIRSLSW